MALSPQPNNLTNKINKNNVKFVMQIDIITKNAVELKAGDSKVTTISSNESRIELTAIVKTATSEKYYKLIATDKNGEPKLRAE